MEKQRVQKFIQLSGLYSRRKAEELIAKGLVKVNNEVISLGDMCTQNDEIKINDQKINFENKTKKYYLLNKSRGYVCSNDDPHNKETVFDLLKGEDTTGLFSVGRLDKDTTGLLILTNDGDFANKIIHPSSKIKKEYIAKLNKKLDLNHKKQIEKGIILDDYKLTPCSIKQLGDKFLIKINEGKKRQIRRMFEKFNYLVTDLERIKIGKLELRKSGLRPGKFKKVNLELLEKEIFNF